MCSEFLFDEKYYFINSDYIKKYTIYSLSANMNDK